VGSVARWRACGIFLMVTLMQYLLASIVGIAAYAGYKGWPMYTVLPVSGAFTVWMVVYYGRYSMHTATGGPAAYLFRVSVFNIILASALYGAGVVVHHLIG
jgi:hypothetical protein